MRVAFALDNFLQPFTYRFTSLHDAKPNLKQLLFSWSKRHYLYGPRRLMTKDGVYSLS